MDKDAEVPAFVDLPGPIVTPAGKSVKSEKPSQAFETWVGNSLTVCSNLCIFRIL